MLAGPQGVGKTTIAQQLALSRIGVHGPSLLSLTVTPTSAKVLYLAMDRPMQAARSMRRMVRESDAPLLEERLVVWRGPLPFDCLREPKALIAFATEQQADTVFIDSLKDVVPGLASDEVGSTLNLIFQELIARGIQLFILHHQRKGNRDNKRPDKLDDVYGSTWLTSGMGSIALLWGIPGSSRAELTHVKQPSEVVGPLWVTHDHSTGRSRLDSGDTDLIGALLAAGDAGLTLGGAALALFHDDDKRAQKRARQQLTALVQEGSARHERGKSGGRGGGTQEPGRWFLVEGGGE
jgi:replicative DNA helicase